MTDQIDEAAERYFTRGVDRMNATPPDLPGAVSCFTRALFLCPNASALHAHHGECLLRLCDFSAALVSFRRAHSLSPGDPGIRARLAHLHYLTGRLHLAEGESSQAAQAFTDALELVPRYSDCWLLRIKAWIRGRAYGRALHELNTFIAQADEEEQGASGQQERGALASDGNKQGQTGSNGEESKRLDGDAADTRSPPMAASLTITHALPPNLEAASTGEPVLVRQLAAGMHSPPSALLLTRTVQALLLRAKLHVLLDRSDLALRDAGWAHTLSPSHPEVASLLHSLAHKSDSLYGQATAHVLAGQPRESISLLTRALELNPNDVRCYAMRAALYRGEHRYDEALSDLKGALQITVAIRQAKINRQQQLREAKEAEEAAAASTTESAGVRGAAQADPNAHLAGGRTFLSEVSGADDAAMPSPSSAAAGPSSALVPESADPQQSSLERSLSLTFNGLGVDYFQKGSYGAALSCFNKAIELDPLVGSFFANRADCLLRLGEEAQCLSDLHHSLLLESTSPGLAVPGSVSRSQSVRARIGSIHASRGRQCFNDTQYEAAESEFARAIGADPTTSSHYMARARTYVALQQYERAYRDAEEAVRLRPDDQAARAFLMQMRQMLLRPADLARAPPLPPLPPPDTPWNAHAALKAHHRSTPASGGHRTAGGDVLRMVLGGAAAGSHSSSDGQPGLFVKQRTRARRR